MDTMREGNIECGHSYVSGWKLLATQRGRQKKAMDVLAANKEMTLDQAHRVSKKVTAK